MDTSGSDDDRLPAREPWEAPVPVVRLVRTAWPVLWLVMFVLGHWQAGLVLLLLTGPVMSALRPSRRARRREQRRSDRRRHELADRHGEDRWRDLPVPHGPVLHEPVPVPAPQAATAAGDAAASPAERSLAATLVRAEGSGSRLDPEALALVREVDALLRPLLAHVRARGADPLVRRDLEAVATEHLPAALDAYLVLPADYAHAPRTSSATTPADELRSQLLVLVEGCRQLRDAVHDADLDRQQQLSRFLEAKFRRSDLDL